MCQKRGLIGSQCRVMTDATLIAADASLESFVPNEPEAIADPADAPPDRLFRKVSNQTHHSHTDPDATLAQKKGTPQQLKYKRVRIPPFAALIAE